jgi:hypothetical protein
MSTIATRIRLHNCTFTDEAEGVWRETFDRRINQQVFKFKFRCDDRESLEELHELVQAELRSLQSFSDVREALTAIDDEDYGCREEQLFRRYVAMTGKAPTVNPETGEIIIPFNPVNAAVSDICFATVYSAAIDPPKVTNAATCENLKGRTGTVTGRLKTTDTGFVLFVADYIDLDLDLQE